MLINDLPSLSLVTDELTEHPISPLLSVPGYLLDGLFLIYGSAL